MTSIQVRDSRKPGNFWASNQIIRRDGQTLGVYGVAVYCTLATYANNDDQTAYPSVTTIAEQLGCSPRKVRYSLGKLEEMGWISVSRRTDPKNPKRALSNTYTLLEPPPPAQDAWGTAPDAGGGSPVPEAAAEEEPGTAPHAGGEEPENGAEEPEMPQTPAPDAGGDVPETGGVLHEVQGGTAQDAGGYCTPCRGVLHDMQEGTAPGAEKLNSFELYPQNINPGNKKSPGTADAVPGGSRAAARRKARPIPQQDIDPVQEKPAPAAPPPLPADDVIPLGLPTAADAEPPTPPAPPAQNDETPTFDELQIHTWLQQSVKEITAQLRSGEIPREAIPALLSAERGFNKPRKSLLSGLVQIQHSVPAAVFQPMFGAICTAFGWDAKKLTDDERGQVNSAAAQLARAEYKPEDVQAIYDYCKQQDWSTGFKPTVLPNHASAAMAAQSGHGQSYGPGWDATRQEQAKRFNDPSNPRRKIQVSEDIQRQLDEILAREKDLQEA